MRVGMREGEEIQRERQRTRRRNRLKGKGQTGDPTSEGETKYGTGQ